MNAPCHICDFLKHPTHRILTTSKWTVGLDNNQAYLGRAYVTLRAHKASLSDLDTRDWQEFQNVVKKLENAYAKAFGALPINWGCFMNLAFREEPPHPHVHWHVYPRYKQAPKLAGIIFDDPLYEQHYDHKAKRFVNDKVVSEIAAKLVTYL